MPNPFRSSRAALILCALAILALASPATPAHAQQALGQAVATAPQNPATPPGDDDQQAGAPNGASPKKNDRLFGIVPNYATVEGASDAPPLTTGQKFKMTAQGAFDPYEFAVVGMLAGFNQAENEDTAYGQGAAGYGKRYGAGFADQAIGNFMTGAIFPTILREDPRYFQLGRGNFGRRFFYAASRLLITRTDAGHMQFNFSEFFGNAAAAGISNLYEVPQDRTFSNTSTTWTEQIAVDGLAFELKEFWPDIRRRVFHKR